LVPGTAAGRPPAVRRRCKGGVAYHAAVSCGHRARSSSDSAGHQVSLLGCAPARGCRAIGDDVNRRAGRPVAVLIGMTVPEPVTA